MSSSSSAAVGRTTSRVLRDKGIDERIKCTLTLVASYNVEEDPKGREALRKWLEIYFDEFSQLRTGSIPRKAIAEFVNLAEIKIREPADVDLVRRVYTTLQEVVMTKEGCSMYFVLALEHILSIIDKEIIQDDAKALVALADRLIELTDPKKMPLTRDIFEYHTGCLHAFERVLMVLHDLEKDRSDNHIVKFFEDRTKRHLDMIISCQHYYPFAYQALLVKENIKKLFEKNIKSLLINGGRRAFYAFRGGLFIFQAIRELAEVKLDFGALESGIGKFGEAFKDIGWDITTEIQEVVLAASETVRLDDFGVFQQCYDKHKKVSWVEGLKWSKQRAIRYALVSHLCLFCTKDYSKSIQTAALDLLVQLVTNDEGKQWRDDRHIFEAMIEALIAIGEQNQEHEGRIINAFKTIRTSQTKQHKKTIDECLNGVRFEERIKCGYKREADDTSRSLFHFTRQRLGLHANAAIYKQNQQTLKDSYKSDSFAKVSLFADENGQHHIKTFEFNLEEYEKVVVPREREGQSSQSDFNQRENNFQRSTLVKKHMAMKDLFRKRCIHPLGLQENAQRILLIGNPGTGKTCLSKRLCHDWAANEWGLEFEHVYLLPIRKLSENRVGHCGDLPSLILELIYQVQPTQGLNNTLYKEVQDNLSEASTLLILDGYDEAGDKAKDLVSSALTLDCSLLILSRPHSVQAIRPRADTVVECLELSNKQLESFVRNEIGSNDGDDLDKFLSKNLSIKDICRVAVNAQIIIRLWKSSYKEELLASSSANITSFYSMILDYTWIRFTSKIEVELNKNSMFDSLEHIAFESFQQGQVEIPERLVFKHAQGSMKVLCASGFLLFVKEGKVFQFAHLTFHEFFAGSYLAKMLKSTSGEEKKRAKKVIAQHKYIETSRVMLSFMTQHYCRREDVEESLDAFKYLMKALDKDPLPTIDIQHLLLRMRTLDAFLPCGIDEAEVHTYDDVVQIVNDAMEALKRWFGYELGGDKGRFVLCQGSDFRTPIIDDLARMPNLFNRFPNLLKPVLLNEDVKVTYEFGNYYRRDFASIGRLNPHHALQCILPLLDDVIDEAQACMIQLCAFIGPMCAEPTLDHLKRLCKSQDRETRGMATKVLIVFIDLFPKREDVRQLMVDAYRDQEWLVHNAFMLSIRNGTFMQETEAGTFVWDLLLRATKEDDEEVRRHAVNSCVQHYQTFAISVDEVMELVRDFATSPDFNDRWSAADAIEDFIQKAPEKSNELPHLLKTLCSDPQWYVHINAADSFQTIIESSCLGREDLFNVAFDLFKDGYLDVQVKLLPFLFSFDKKESRGIDGVNEFIATCQDLDDEVQEKAISCCKAKALRSKHTIEEIHDRFYDQDKEVQLEIVRQIYMREIETNKGADAITEMAVHCLLLYNTYKPSMNLLEKMSKTELLPNIVLERLAKQTRQPMTTYVERQPLSHLLDYYWSRKDRNMIWCIARKLLLSPVIFEQKGETDMAVTFREKGANMKQTAPFEVVQDLLYLCNDYLKKMYGLNFFSD